MLIDTVTLYRFSLPLIEPYKLAMGVVGAFDTVLAVIEDGGGTGFGEATILTGYTEETIDGCWRVARGLGKRPVLAPARHPAIDQSGIARRAICGAKAQPLHHPWAKAFD